MTGHGCARTTVPSSHSAELHENRRHPLLHISALSVPCPVSAENASQPGEPVLEPATLCSLGVYWIVKGDDNANAKISVAYRATGLTAATEWEMGPPLFRVEKGAEQHGKWGLAVAPDSWLFAGSVFLLTPNTEYELKLSLSDPDGGSVERTVARARTIAEPIASPGAPVRHVSAEAGPAGDGTEGRPFRGLEAAQKAAEPGDIMLLHPGRYEGPFYVSKSGEPGKPIVWRGMVTAGKMPVVDGMRLRDHLNGAAIDAFGVHDVWFEKLEAANAYNLVRANESSRIVVRQCFLHDGICGIVATRNDTGQVKDFFICDNTIDGFMPWPTTQKQWHDLPESRGIWITGSGHDVCYNRVRHMKDGMDVDESVACHAIDLHNNDISEMFDDGTEMDESERNTRCFENRYTNVFQGISFQPIFGGPVIRLPQCALQRSGRSPLNFTTARRERSWFTTRSSNTGRRRF